MPQLQKHHNPHGSPVTPPTSSQTTRLWTGLAARCTRVAWGPLLSADTQVNGQVGQVAPALHPVEILTEGNPLSSLISQDPAEVGAQEKALLGFYDSLHPELCS